MQSLKQRRYQIESPLYDMKSYPKVLLLSDTFDNTTGMGVTLTNLFKDWPRECIAVAGFNVNPDLCDRIRPCSAYYALDRRFSSGSNTGGQAKQRSKIRTIAKYIYTKVGISDLRPIHIDERLKQFIDNFNPDIIFSALGDLKRIKFTKAIKEYCPKARIALYVVDDWVNTRFAGRCFASLWHRKYLADFSKIIGKADIRLSICDYMSEEYFKQFGYHFIPFHNPVNTLAWLNTEGLRQHSGSCFSVVYVGKINKDTEQNILNLAKVVSSLNKGGFEVAFDVYTPSKYRINTSALKGFTIHPAVPNTEIPALLRGYDALFLPLGFSRESRSYTRLSMPTKLTEYLASGVPIIVNAPAEIAVTRYVRDTETAEICDSDSIDSIKDSVIRLITNTDLRVRLSNNALKTAALHDINVITKNFRKALS